MIMLDYTIWFADDDPGGDYMWSFATDEAAERTVEQGGGAMFAPLVKDGITHAFTLLKKSHPVVSELVRQTDEIKIIGRNGKIDLLNALLDAPVFDNRTITEEFVLMANESGAGDYRISDPKEWAELTSQIKEYFNSYKKFRIVLSHDRGFYYLGTLTASVEPERYRMIIKITADVEPYKYERYSSVEPWIWDDFSFIDGIIRDYSEITMDENHSAKLDIPMRTGNVVPRFKIVGDYDPLVSAVIDLIEGENSFGALLLTAFRARQYSTQLTSDLSSVLSDIVDAYNALTTGTGYSLPVVDNLLDGDDDLASFVTQLEAEILAAGGTDGAVVGPTDKIVNTVYALTERLDTMTNEIKINAVQATTDDPNSTLVPVEWYGVAYPDDEDVGYTETGITLEGKRLSGQTVTVWFRGIGTVAMEMRGKAL